jgi:membrane associated rhomboid family serine protease
MCPNCRAFITTDDKICPYCDVKVGARAVDRRTPADALGGLIPAARFTTAMILLINFGLFIVTAIFSMKSGNDNAFMGVDSRTLIFFGAKFPPLMFQNGEWWRLITAGFLHGGLFHIGMNCWVLFDLGTTVEHFYGTRRMLVIYFISSVTGFLASTFWSMNPSVGASAALFGLIGAMIALGLQDRSGLGAAIKGMYIRWAIYGMVFGLMIPMIDNAAHLGGLAGGFAVGYLAGTPKLVEDWRENLWKWLAYGCIGMTVLAFVRMFMGYQEFMKYIQQG